MTVHSDLHLVINPAARQGRTLGLTPRLAKNLASHEDSLQIHKPDSPEAATALFERLGQTEVARVIVAGGDGMVQLAAQGLAGTSTVLGIIGAGTGNDTVGGLGLPTDLDAACAVAADGPPRAIDVIRSGDRVAVTVATLGFSVAVNERANRMRFPRGGARYTVATLLEMPRLKSHRLTISVDGDEQEIETNLVAIGNTSDFGGGMHVAPDANPFDGQLDVVTMGPGGPIEFGRVFPRAFNGSHVHHPAVKVRRGSLVEIHGVGESAAMTVRADGEPFATLPAIMTVDPKALLVAGA